MSSNYLIILNKLERHEGYVRHIFRALFSGPNSTLNHFIEKTKDDRYKVTEVLEGYLIQNDTQRYNNTVLAKKWTNTDP